MTSNGMTSQKSEVNKLAFFKAKTVVIILLKIHDKLTNPIQKDMKPTVRERKLVKTPNSIRSETSPNGAKPPIKRYPVEFANVQKASQNSITAKCHRIFLFQNRKT